MKTEGGYLIGRIKYLSGRRLNKLFSESGLNEFNGEQGKILQSVLRTNIERRQGLHGRSQELDWNTDYFF